VDLYADGTDQASEDNQKMELAKFQTIAEPFYAIMDPDEKVIATFPGLTKDPQEYMAFLSKGSTPVAPAVPPPTSASASALPQVNQLDGGPLNTAALGGKVVVVNFWATWCVPCIAEIPSFNKLHRQLGSKGVVVLGVSMDQEGAERVRPFLKKHAMDYTVALGSDAVSNQFGLSDLLPVTVVFDRSGKQVKRFDGLVTEAELQTVVERAML
jgi:thiol-disulfide isomerase/thioredoxin